MAEEISALQLLSDKLKDQSLELQFERRISDLEKSNKENTLQMKWLENRLEDSPRNFELKNIKREVEAELQEDIRNRFLGLYGWFLLGSFVWAFLTSLLSWFFFSIYGK